VPDYTRAEAKEWARATWRGACNVIIPSYRRDLRSLDEAGIRHDVRRNIELGFWGALLVSEVPMTDTELRTFMDVAVDEAAGRQRFLLQLSFDTLDQMRAAARTAQDAGVDALLMAYPNSFYPRTVAELTAFTREVCQASDLGVLLFCAPHYNLERLDVSGYPMAVWDELVDLETIVGLKYEVGQPGVLGSYECFRRFADRGVVVCDPYEPNLLVWSDLFDVPWVGTSNYEYLGDLVPRILTSLANGDRATAVDLYWKAQPARVVRDRLRREVLGGNLNHRYLWKYQAWLMGYNGGPLRGPVMKLTDAQMHAAADAVLRAGLLDALPGGPADFYAGRSAS
jgi:dihydrodipicolinate synthase/N-acetylneuraminate lyase